MRVTAALWSFVTCAALHSCANRDGHSGEATTGAAPAASPAETNAGAAGKVGDTPLAPAPTRSEPAAPYPVRWSPALELESLDKLDARLATADGLGFGEFELGDERSLPTNCRQWAELHRAGYVPSTALETQPDSGALLRCEALRVLKHARPARVSFVRELPTPGPELLRILPAAFATAESPQRLERLHTLTEQGAPFTALDPKAKVEKWDDPGLARILEGDGQSLVDVQPWLGVTSTPMASTTSPWQCATR